MPSKRICGSLLLALGLLLSGCAHRHQVTALPPTDYAVDPPGQVARISYIRGELSLKTSGSSSWIPAGINQPLTLGDELWTNANGLAELQTRSSVIRLAAATQISFLNLDDNVVQIRLISGVLRVRLREIEGDEGFELNTPNAAVSLLRAGDYRLEVQPQPPSALLMVRSGTAEVSGLNRNFVVHSGEEATLTGLDTLSHSLAPVRREDTFDEFCSSRDRRDDASASAQHVSRDVIGYQDLDAYGAWRVDATWGPVWLPNGVPPRWAPYRFGRWVWLPPWGWTWVDDTPWGFAPFHYGRWIQINANWGWIPGPRQRRPVWAPALVVFVGGGGADLRYHFPLSSGLGVAWFPLGPREVYLPPFRASRNYVTRINVTNTIVDRPDRLHQLDPLQQNYRNRAAVGAVTAVPREDFVRSRPLRGVAVEPTPAELSRSRVSGSAPPINRAREGAPPVERRAAAPPATPNQPAVVRRAPQSGDPNLRQAPTPRVERSAPGRETPTRQPTIPPTQRQRSPSPTRIERQRDQGIERERTRPSPSSSRKKQE